MIESRTIPGTEITVSSLGFGTASLHHLSSRRKQLNLLATAAELDIRHFDTAPAYGFGLAEDSLGHFLRGRRNDFTVTTKIGLFPRLGRAGTLAGLLWRKLLLKSPAAGEQFTKDCSLPRLKASVTSSLDALKTDYLDFLLLHEPNWPVDDEVTGWLESQCENGRIRAWGVSGERAAVEPFLSNSHKAARLLQTRDSLDLKQADFVIEAGRPFQFTYGYFSAGATAIDQVLARNSTGCVLFSTRHVNRLLEMLER